MPARHASRVGLTVLLGLTAACQAAPATIAVVETAPPTATRVPTEKPSPAPTAIRTPPSLPAPYQSKYTNPLDSPYSYEQDTCTYLRNKWDSSKAAPGTVVIIIMLHSINRDKGEGPDAMTAALFGRMLADLQETRFEAINMDQLAGFLENNDRIPARSVVMIQDGRRYPDNFNAHFRAPWDEWGWPVVNAWDAQGTTTDSIWEQYLALSDEGMVDFQAYGPTFGAKAKPPSDKYLRAQLQKPIDVLEERLGKKPIGVVWPSGFSTESVSIARELGYRLGFTFNPRGPVMYNWIPQSDTEDKFRPSYQPEAPVGDPLMTLPRFWPIQVHKALDQVRILGDQAAEYAERNKITELEYYDIVCAAEYGSIPQD